MLVRYIHCLQMTFFQTKGEGELMGCRHLPEDGGSGNELAQSSLQYRLFGEPILWDGSGTGRICLRKSKGRPIYPFFARTYPMLPVLRFGMPFVGSAPAGEL